MSKLRLASFAMVILPLLWMVTVFSGIGTFWQTLISLPFLFLVPGYFGLRIITGYRRRFDAETLVYTLGLSTVFLMVIGFLVNEIGLYLHDPHPLERLPLALTIGLTTSALGLLASLRRPKLKLPRLSRPHRLGTIVMGLLLPVLAVGGAITLNNGGSNGLAMLALAATAVFGLAVIWKPRGHNWVYSFALYVMSLTLLFGTSMRGWNITGHDVMQEFQVFQLTAEHSVWHMHFYQDAYNACLSITILPTVLQRLTGLPNQYIFKFATQLYAAAIAPVLYLSLRRYVTAVMAFLAGLVFITFPTFITDMAMLNRQETAFLCLALGILVMLDNKLKRRSKSILGFIFLSGMVLSHYSTSYVAMGTLVIAAVIMVVLKWVRKDMRSRLPVFPIPVIVGALLVLIAWSTLATQTSGNLTTTIDGVIGDLPKLVTTIGIPSTSQPSGDAAQMVAQYTASVEAMAKPSGTIYYPAATTVGDTWPTARPETVDKLTRVGSALHLSASLIYKLYDWIKQGYAKLIQALILLGLGVVILSRRARKGLPSGYIVVGVASLVMIGLQVVLPSSLVNYGLLRTIQQELLFLAFPVVAAGFWLLTRLRVPKRWQHRVVAGVVMAFFVVLSGLLPAVTGGYKAALPVSNSGFYYEAYYTHQDEVASDQWLAQNVPLGSQVNSDEFTRRQLITYGGIFATPTLVPAAIPVDAYVMLSDTNTTLNHVPAYYGSDLIYYSLPTQFLQSNKNLVYSTGTVKIYR